MSTNVNNCVDRALSVVHCAHVVTITDIQRELEPYKKVTDRQLRRYIDTFKIKPLGKRQRPQQYPDNAGKRIVKALGLNGHIGRAA